MVGNDSDKAADKENFWLTFSRRSCCYILTNDGVCACFAILEYADQFIVKNSWIHNKNVCWKSFGNIFSEI